MNEENLFKIQHEQVLEEIERIKWIADNKDQLIRALRKVVCKSDESWRLETLFTA